MIQVQTTQLNKFKQFIGFAVVTLAARRSQVSEVLLSSSRKSNISVCSVLRVLRIDCKLTTLYKNGYSILLINRLKAYLIKWFHFFFFLN